MALARRILPCQLAIRASAQPRNSHFSVLAITHIFTRYSALGEVFQRDFACSGLDAILLEKDYMSTRFILAQYKVFEDCEATRPADHHTYQQATYYPGKYAAR